jgi:ParB-like chromosome segregation protein Spo0J
MSEEVQMVQAEDAITLRVPMKLRRRSGRQHIGASPPLGRTRHPKDQTPSALAVAVARAHRWQELIDEGRFASMSELAKALGVDFAYVARLMQLTLLAPDVVQAILDGREAPGLSLEKLRHGFPLACQEQRMQLVA